MLAGISTALSTPELSREIEEFFKSHHVKQGQKTLDQHLERLQINLAFRQRESSKLATIRCSHFPLASCSLPLSRVRERGRGVRGARRGWRGQV